MMDHLPFFSSHISHIQHLPDSLPKIPQNLKVTPTEKVDSVPGTAIAMTLALSLPVPQVNVWDAKDTKCIRV